MHTTRSCNPPDRPPRHSEGGHGERPVHRRVIGAALLAGLVLGAGGVATAYFTSGGAGTGHVEVGTTTGSFVITADATATPLLPDGIPREFDVAMTNTGGADAHIGTIYESVSRFGDSGDAATGDGADIPGCSADWFTVTPTVVVDRLVAPGSTSYLSDGGLALPTVTLSDSGTDQDACQGRSVGITFTTVDP